MGTPVTAPHVLCGCEVGPAAGLGVAEGSALGEALGAAVNCTVSTLAAQENPGVLSQSTMRQQGGPFTQGTPLLEMGASAPPDVPALPSA